MGYSRRELWSTGLLWGSRRGCGVGALCIVTRVEVLTPSHPPADAGVQDRDHVSSPTMYEGKLTLS